MKIAILSMQRIDNFGSLLQAYSLQKIFIVHSSHFGFFASQIARPWYTSK